MALTQAQIDAYEADGFLTGITALGPDQVRDLIDHLRGRHGQLIETIPPQPLSLHPCTTRCGASPPLPAAVGRPLAGPGVPPALPVSGRLHRVSGRGALQPGIVVGGKQHGQEEI